MERVLLEKIDVFAARVILLLPALVKQWKEAICGETVGINRVGRLVERYKDVFHSLPTQRRRDCKKIPQRSGGAEGLLKSRDFWTDICR